MGEIRKDKRSDWIAIIDIDCIEVLIENEKS